MVIKKYDYIVIGGGVNSLVAAALLGKKNKSVLLLESKKKTGGMAVSKEFFPGFRANVIYDYIQWFDQRIIKELNLDKNGFGFINNDINRISLDLNNNHIFFDKNIQKTLSSISFHSKKDAEKWIDFSKYISKITSFLKPLYEITPPDFKKIGVKDAISMSALLKPMWTHGSRGFVDILRTAPMMMPELLDEWFESELLRATLSASGIHHLNQGPYSAATVLNFLHQHIYSESDILKTNFINGGTERLSSILEERAKYYNVEIKTNSNVISIDCSDNVCVGVTLENQDNFLSNNIISGLDQNNTCIKLLGLENIKPSYRTQLNNIKYRGSTARIHFALNDLPKINGIKQEELQTVFSICPSVDFLEKAYDEVKYGKVSSSPYIEFCLPSILTPEYSNNGKHILSASVQYVPYHLRNNNWNKNLKNQIVKSVIKTLDLYISNFSKIIIGSSISTPLDFENSLRITEGNFNHGEMTLDQFFFMRPTISSSQYRTPIKNLFICGPSTHPGGGLHGANAINMVSEILK